MFSFTFPSVYMGFKWWPSPKTRIEFIALGAGVDLTTVVAPFGLQYNSTGLWSSWCVTHCLFQIESTDIDTLVGTGSISYISVWLYILGWSTSPEWCRVGILRYLYKLYNTANNYRWFRSTSCTECISSKSSL